MPKTLKTEIQAVLRADAGALASRTHLRGEGRYDGYAYPACEAYMELAGADAGLQPMHLRRDGASHWWLRDRRGRVIDLTLARGERSSFPYDEGRPRSFRYTPNGISGRAAEIVVRVLAARERSPAGA